MALVYFPLLVVPGKVIIFTNIGKIYVNIDAPLDSRFGEETAC